MYYDEDKNAFCYYTTGDILYKYLNVVCRKYVIEHNCSSLYKDEISHFVESNSKTNDLFIKKNIKKTLEKNINQFILCGTLEDYYKKIQPSIINDIDIVEYLTFCRY
jgi:hypothetical protein